MKIVIIEDEIPAYEKMLHHIKESIPDFQLLKWLRSVKEANLYFATEPSVDLIFSDIELLDGNVFEFLESYPLKCPIIFCTAFEQYLLQAFQNYGIAYLLKPYEAEKFKEALDKYQVLFSGQKSEGLNEHLISELKKILDNERNHFKRRFTIKKKKGIKILNVEEIVAIQASGDFCLAFDVHQEKHIINSSLSEIESKLDPKYFFRINRSEMINIDYVLNIEPYFKNRLAIKLRYLSETFYTSSSKTPSFRSWLDS